uniref:Uncharacterized protein n=2 Tax=Parascaris univalens TaxID=6257 RepID=A0A915CBB4_PARUN
MTTTRSPTTPAVSRPSLQAVCGCSRVRRRLSDRMEANVVDVLDELYDKARAVLESFPTDKEYNDTFSNMERIRKSIRESVNELIRKLDSYRSSMIVRLKEQQAQLQTQEANINVLEKCFERRQAELSELRNDLEERTEERDLSKEQISQKRALLDEQEKQASAFNVGISRVKEDREEFTKYLKMVSPPIDL